MCTIHNHSRIYHTPMHFRVRRAARQIVQRITCNKMHVVHHNVGTVALKDVKDTRVELVQLSAAIKSYVPQCAHVYTMLQGPFQSRYTIIVVTISHVDADSNNLTP